MQLRDDARVGGRGPAAVVLRARPLRAPPRLVRGRPPARDRIHPRLPGELRLPISPPHPLLTRTADV
jgi:hypothetical protein